ncbi:hypothetical protein [Microbulbifer sp. TRSA007]|uniref:hypothetical protein n=1 Tax=Microbulbifer sp. TRSA007 TaxID=3243384 RepID=UPI0040391A55
MSSSDRDPSSYNISNQVRISSLGLAEDRVPQHLHPILSFINSWANGQDAPVTITIGGSIASGEADAFSDLDVTAVYMSTNPLNRARAEFEQMFTQHFNICVTFSAVHAGIPSLLVFYTRQDDWIVKLDISFLYCADPPCCIQEPFIVLRKDIPINQNTMPDTESMSVQDIIPRYCGWLWYTFAKIKRGESLAACDSLAFTRKHAIIPLIQQATGVKLQGDRRLEQRLPTDWVEQLHNTHPRTLKPEDLYLSQASLHQIFLRAVNEIGKSDLLLEEQKYNQLVDVLRRQGLTIDWPE